MSGRDDAAVSAAKVGAKATVIVAVIGVIGGLAGSLVQHVLAQPATESRVEEIVSERLPIGTITASMPEPSLFARAAGGGQP